MCYIYAYVLPFGVQIYIEYVWLVVEMIAGIEQHWAFSLPSTVPSIGVIKCWLDTEGMRSSTTRL